MARASASECSRLRTRLRDTRWRAPLAIFDPRRV